MQYRFGDRVLDTDRRELRAGTDAIELEPQVFDVLTYLVAHRERVVSKEELFDQVWGDRFVSESALTTRIKQARQAVGDTGQRQAVIKTLHGRGYRFVGAVAADEARPTASPRPIQPAVSSIPRTRYAEGDGASIAYQTFGEGPDIVFIAGFTTNVEVQWEHPGIAAFLRRLSSFSRVTILDKRGVGLSDRMPHDDPPALETRADDLLAVMEAAGIAQATVLGSSEGGSLAAHFTASHPERAARLVLHNTWLSASEADLVNDDAREFLSRHWGSGATLAYLGPTLGADQPGRTVLARLERQAATPRAAQQLLELIGRIDISAALGAISVPTLVVHRVDDPVIPVSQGRELSARIPGARFVQLAGSDHWIFSGHLDDLLTSIEEFVTGSPAVRMVTDRLLATVLFVDIVDSTANAQRMGDKAWTGLLDQFQSTVARVIGEHRGEVVNTTGDGVVATFDGPGRAVHAAGAIRAAAAPLGLSVRCGLHTAEIERRGTDIAGIGVHIASRVASAAVPGEIWVSRTVTDLVAGTGLVFEDRGTYEFKGIDEPWALFASRL
jgi:pimeloyl-ACP methyl ester carboxylesterase/DNA-binding winged helix-turn-helix (wHTH) protein